MNSLSDNHTAPKNGSGLSGCCAQKSCTLTYGSVDEFLSKQLAMSFCTCLFCAAFCWDWCFNERQRTQVAIAVDLHSCSRAPAVQILIDDDFEHVAWSKQVGLIPCTSQLPRVLTKKLLGSSCCCLRDSCAWQAG